MFLTILVLQKWSSRTLSLWWRGMCEGDQCLHRQKTFQDSSRSEYFHLMAHTQQWSNSCQTITYPPMFFMKCFDTCYGIEEVLEYFLLLLFHWCVLPFCTFFFIYEITEKGWRMMSCSKCSTSRLSFSRFANVPGPPAFLVCLIFLPQR